MTGLGALLGQGSPDTSNDLLLGTVTARTSIWAATVRIDGATSTISATLTVPAYNFDRVLVRTVGKMAYVVQNINFDTGWVTPTLLGAWTNYAAGYPGAGYRKINGITYLKGLVKGGASGSDIFVLGTDFRPPTGINLYNGVDGSNTTARVDVDGASGRVFHQAGNTGFISLNGIRFPAEQ